MIMDANYTVVDGLQAKAKRDLLDEILNKAQFYLKGSQLMELNKTLNECLSNYEVFIEQNTKLHENYEEENKEIIKLYIQNKKLEGLSPRTTYFYESNISKFVEWIDKPLADVVTQDIRDYFDYAQKLHNCGSITLDTTRRILNTFFTTITNEGYIQSNPMVRIKKIKSAKKVKKPFTDLEIEKMRDQLNKLPEKTHTDLLIKYRDQALFELLLSSGIRIAECVNLNKNDIDLNNRRFIVLGKGNKERMCYFSVKCQFYLEKLLNFKYSGRTRKYQNVDALFISKRGQNNRYSINGVERRIRELGNRCGVNAHPHKFRRTFATNLVNKGVPLEQVKELMGHSNMDTTLIYAMVDQDQVRHNHNKFAG